MKPTEPLTIDILELTTDENEWVVLNMESAYYRVHYDNNTWSEIIEELHNYSNEKIDAINRAQLVDNELNLAKAGIVPYERAFQVFTYLINETDYIPWLSTVSEHNLIFFDNLLLTDKCTYDYFNVHL